MEQIKNEQCEAIKLQDEEHKKLLQDLENCRVDAIKEVTKLKDEFAENLAEVMEKGSCHEGLLNKQLKQLEKQSESLTFELEERIHQIAAERESKQELELDLQKISLELQENQKKLEQYSRLTNENSKLSERLRDAENEIAQLKELMEKSNHDELAKKLEKKVKSEKALRVEMAQLRSEVARMNSNEKHLEDHVASLEEQINEMVSDYESKLRLQATKVASEYSVFIII